MTISLASLWTRARMVMALRRLPDSMVELMYFRARAYVAAGIEFDDDAEATFLDRDACLVDAIWREQIRNTPRRPIATAEATIQGDGGTTL